MAKHRMNRIRRRKPINLWSRLIARSQAGGQALIEYVLIIVLVTIALIAVLAITGPAVGNVFSNTVYNLLGGTVEPRATLGRDEFWTQVAAVASYTPESPSLVTNTPAPATLVPTLRPTIDATPTYTPTATETYTPGPSPTPLDHDFGYPFDDPGNNPDWWEHDFGGPFDNIEWNAEYWDLSRWDTNSKASNMDGASFDPGKGKHRETLTKIDIDWGDTGPGGGVQKNFYGRFTATATFEAKQYTLRVLKDDGVRIWIGGQQIVDEWAQQPHHATWFNTNFTAAAGSLDVKIEFYDSKGDAEIHVELVNTGGDQGDCNWAISNEQFHSSPTSWSDSPGKDYDPGSVCTLQLRGSIDLRGANRPTLEFWDRYALNANTTARVGIAIYGSGAWTDVDIHYNDTNLGWTRQTFDLTNFGTGTPVDFRGQLIEIRFILDAKNATSGAGGWWLDDIQVEQEVLRRYTVGFSDDMEGPSHWYPGGSWALSNERTHSGGKAWSDSPGQKYQDDSDNYLELDGLVDMADPAVVDPELVFWHRYNLVDYDKISAEISLDHETWTPLKVLADSVSNLSWTQQVISLGAYSGQEFYFRFRLDARLNGATADGWWIDDFSLRNRANTTITLDWCDNMEVGGSNWMPDGQWGVVSGPDINSGSQNSNQTVTAHSGSQFWSDSPRTDYEHSTSSSLQLKSNVDLSGAQNPELVFWHQWDVADSDDLHVEVSEDNGENWTPIWSFNYDGKPAGYGSAPNRGYNSVLSWTRETVSLRQYIDKIVHVRFRIEALISSAVDDGWWVDDVCFQEYNQPVRSLPFRDGFERGSANWFEGGTWTIAPDGKHTGAVSYTDSYGVDYKHESNSILELRGAVDLRGSVKPTLYFWEVFELADRDYSLVEISSSTNGTTWSDWNQVFYHERTTTISWDRRAVNLDSYRDKLIRIRFRLYAVDDNDIDNGWRIDDVSVIERDGAEPLHSLPFLEDAESNSGNWVLDGAWSRMPTQRGIGSGSELGPGGWRGEYYASDPSKCSQPIIGDATLVDTRTDEEIAFDFDSNKPFGMSDCFIVRWTRAIYVPADDTTYEIQTKSDDGIRVYVDYNEVGSPPNVQREINEWRNRSYSQSPDRATVTLSEGFHNIIVEYYENTGGADIDVDFTLDGMVYHDSPTGDYYKYDDASVTLEGMIDLTGTTTPALTYWEKRSLGTNHTVYTEISTDEGFTWTVIKQKTGTDNTWRKTLINLSTYAGQKVNIRFRLDARANRDTEDGWFIDDILVAE